MSKKDDLLIEILTEELPPKSLLKFAKSFKVFIDEQLQKAGFEFQTSQFFVTPRRLALLVHKLSAYQPEQEIERKGPAIKAAFDANGKPTPACIGFARSCGVSVEDLIHIQNSQGEWVGFKQKASGKSITELMPSFVAQALAQLPIAKRMRWNDGDAQFVRPVHSSILLFGDEVIHTTILDVQTGRVTYGHRFLAGTAITIPHASSYESLLTTEGYVIADFDKRREIIKTKSLTEAQTIAKDAQILMDENLLAEVTGLVEWPVVLTGKFDAEFLALPREVLISAMEKHQRYFPVVDTNQSLLPYFILVSNITSHDTKRVVHGNERVLRARLSDAKFFYDTDKKQSLAERIPFLKGIIFQAKLGTLHDKAERLAKLTGFIAENIHIDKEAAARAGWLAKTDLTTNMVNEFPELQGVMGRYYASLDKESQAVSHAMREQYLPRFAGDELPQHALGQALAIADRIDLLVGIFGINQAPTGDKDPFALRRAALGILRILIDKQINLDLKALLEFSLQCYGDKLENKNIIPMIINFMQERLRAWYLEQAVPADVFAAVSALEITIPLDFHERIKAVQAFKKLKAAETLSVANKRVSNILAKYVDAIDAKKINPDFFEDKFEKELAHQLELKSKALGNLYESRKYEEALLTLAELRKPVDDFFDHVLVMTEDKSRRENRILLLSKLRALFLQVADIALLQ